jgi:hypothetical protein
MLLTTNDLAALDHCGEREAASRYARPASARDADSCRALARAGLTECVRGEEYRLTADGRAAQRLIGGMQAAGVLPARQVLAPDWHFIDDDVLSALETAARTDGRVAPAAASPLLARGLAALFDEPYELRTTIALTVYGRAWRDLARRLRSAPGEHGTRDDRTRPIRAERAPV